MEFINQFRLLYQNFSKKRPIIWTKVLLFQISNIFFIHIISYNGT